VLSLYLKNANSDSTFESSANNEEEISDQWRVADSGQLLVLSDTGANLLSDSLTISGPDCHSDPSRLYIFPRLENPPPPRQCRPQTLQPRNHFWLTFEPTSPPRSTITSVVSSHHLAHSLSFVPAHHQPHHSHFFEKRSRSFRVEGEHMTHRSGCLPVRLSVQDFHGGFYRSKV
jgi:hypothetical protein